MQRSQCLLSGNLQVVFMSLSPWDSDKQWRWENTEASMKARLLIALLEHMKLIKSYIKLSSVLLYWTFMQTMESGLATS